MKYSNFNVEFKSPEKELKEQLQRANARNVDIRRNYRGDLEVRYTLECANPQKEIEEVLKSGGAKNVRVNESYSGARVEYQLDDIVDEREFKRIAQEKLRRSGYRSY